MTHEDRVKMHMATKEHKLKQLAERVKDEDENEKIIKQKERKASNVPKIDINQFDNDYKVKIAQTEERRRRL